MHETWSPGIPRIELQALFLHFFLTRRFREGKQLELLSPEEELAQKWGLGGEACPTEIYRHTALPDWHVQLSRHALSCSISAPKFMQGGLVTVVTHRGGHSTDALKGWSGHMPGELGI